MFIQLLCFLQFFSLRLLFWYFLEHITLLPVIRIYWGNNFSISRHTVKHVLSQLVKRNNRKTRKSPEKKCQNYWMKITNTFGLLMESFLSSPVSLGGVVALLRKLVGLVQKSNGNGFWNRKQARKATLAG